MQERILDFIITDELVEAVIGQSIADVLEMAKKYERYLYKYNFGELPDNAYILAPTTRIYFRYCKDSEILKQRLYEIIHREFKTIIILADNSHLIMDNPSIVYKRLIKEVKNRYPHFYDTFRSDLFKLLEVSS